MPLPRSSGVEQLARPRRRRSSRHLHPGRQGCCPCSEPSNGPGLSSCCCRRASASTVTRSCTKHPPRLFWRDAALISSPAAPPPPGQPANGSSPAGVTAAPGGRLGPLFVCSARAWELHLPQAPAGALLLTGVFATL